MSSRKIAAKVLVLILLGIGMYLTVLMVMRSGGMPRILFAILAIALGYLLYGAVRNLKRN
jgi:hypothetical protein